MKNHLFRFLLILTIVSIRYNGLLRAQDSPDSGKFDEPALFEGEPIEKFMQWVCKNFQCKIAPFYGHHGIPVSSYVRFAVTEEGDVTDVKILRPIDKSIDDEAFRTVSSSPKWTPAKLNGVPVKTEHIVPIRLERVVRYQSELYDKSKQFYEKYILENTRIPVIDASQTVTVGFIVDEDGNVSNINTGGNDINCAFQYELRTVIASLPKWKDSLTGLTLYYKADYLLDLVFRRPGGTLPDNDSIFITWDEAPIFHKQPSLTYFYEWIRENLKIPGGVYIEDFKRSVSLEFTVTEEGYVIDVKVTNSAIPELDAEAVRVVSSSPRWNAGIRCGNPIKVKYNVNVVFPK